MHEKASEGMMGGGGIYIHGYITNMETKMGALMIHQKGDSIKSQQL